MSWKWISFASVYVLNIVLGISLHFPFAFSAGLYPSNCLSVCLSHMASVRSSSPEIYLLDKFLIVHSYLTCTEGSSTISPSTFQTLFCCFCRSAVLFCRVNMTFLSRFTLDRPPEISSTSSSLSSWHSGRNENSFTRWTSTKSKSNCNVNRIKEIFNKHKAIQIQFQVRAITAENEL